MMDERPITVGADGDDGEEKATAEFLNSRTQKDGPGYSGLKTRPQNKPR